MFANLSFKKKLVLLCVFMSCVSLIIGGVALYGFITFSKVSDDVAKRVIPRTALLNTMDVNYQKIRIQVRTLGFENLSLENRTSAINNALKYVNNYENASKELKAYVTSKEELELYNRLDRQWEDFKSVGVKAIELGKVYDADARAKLLEIFLVHCPEAAGNFQQALDEYTDSIKIELKNAVALSNDVSKEIEFIDMLLVVVMILGTGIGLTVGVTFANRMSNSIRETIDSLTKSSSVLTSNASDISKTSSELSEASQEQDAALHESSASLEEIGSMVKMTADNAMKSSQLATESYDRASKGKNIVVDMNLSMSSINTSIDTIVNELDLNNDKMKEIASLISSIDEKTQVINDIVFQTKLLSFNASVEAARAGEAGKGFAVVAEEVGKLAQMSGGAAVEITEMLSSSVTQVNNIIEDTKNRFSKVVDEARSSVTTGTDIAKECEDILESIVTSVEGVSSSVGEISSATQEQSSGINQLQTALSHVDVLSKSNTGIAQDSSLVSTQLQGQVSILNKSIGDIKGLILGVNDTKAKVVSLEKKVSSIQIPDSEDFIKKAA
ncbi:methyl-accepting chemotaxis protein [Halobacteriovorax sp. BALOs_7]|uniref:HAMP domain-containing methyl-accepting chemotaxis protein n=1 Tax=Halobacteriovorax sp. BALOs_7 TaxID=2109558 RepID=UPI000EA2E91A|nr:methyl-accepting chemotaxis protein [Halobacteriovorax sp. BALOs_7]